MNYIFWADMTLDSIMRANLDCTDVTTVISTGLRGPGQLVLIALLFMVAVVILVTHVTLVWNYIFSLTWVLVQTSIVLE